MQRRLTVNIGVRYDYTIVPVNTYGLGTFNTATGQYVWDIKNPLTGEPPNIQRSGILITATEGYAGDVPIIHQAVAVKAAIDAMDTAFADDRDASF